MTGLGRPLDPDELAASLAGAARAGGVAGAMRVLEELSASEERLTGRRGYGATGFEERARIQREQGDVPGPLSVEGAREDYRGLFGALLRCSFDGIVLNALRTSWIVEVSDSFCALTGYAREELLGRTSVELGLVADDAQHRATAGRAQEGIGGLYEVQLRRKDGDVRAVEFSHQVLPGDELVLTIVRDVTARQSADVELRGARTAAEEANRAKSEFLSRVSHELRTPLNAILGFSQLLDVKRLSPEDREAVAHILASGRRLQELLQDVLDITRIDSGQLRISLEPVRLADVARETLGLMRPLAGERRIRLAPSWSEALEDIHVLADRQRLGQVLLNLVSNAIKYNVDGGIVVVDAALTAGDRVRVGITDTGPGIDQEKLPLLFTPFERLGAEERSVEGTGLGLALSKSLVEAMNGSIDVRTTPNLGTTFTIELPRTQAPAADSGRPTASTGPAVVTETSGTVLYVEDNLVNIRLVEAILRRRPNVRLLTAPTAGRGLAMAREHRPELVLLDLQLPDEPGDTLLRRLRRDPTTVGARIVVTSAEAAPRQIERVLAAGADDYICKPIDVRSLLATVDDLLQGPRHST